MELQQGLVAILDALGAARYNEQEIEQFLKSRELVLELLMQKANAPEVRGGINASFVSTFTFNDTVLIVYRTRYDVSLDDVEHFCLLLRMFEAHSLARGILFRGAISLGTFYVDDDSNTVMGKAVTDAAAWYDRADWVGINATPYASLTIQALWESGDINIDRVLIDYSVPMKDGKVIRLKAINWPKAFWVKGLRPVKPGESARATCLSLLTQHGVPKGTESKHFNSMAFYDRCIELYNVERRKKKEQQTG
jgi:hypothetical protein